LSVNLPIDPKEFFMRLSLLKAAILALTALTLDLWLGDGAEAQEAAPYPNYIRRLFVLPTPPGGQAQAVGDRWPRIPDLPPSDPHHDVIEAVRVTMSQACMNCHSSPQDTNRTETLGLSLSPADATLREQLGLEKRGLVVTGVEPKSVAALAGIVENDILLALQNNFVATVDDFKKSVKSASGKEMVLGLLHEGVSKIVTIPAPFAPGTGHSYGFPPGQTPPKTDAFWIGVSINPASATLRVHLKLTEGVGLVVGDVVSDSPAAKSGIKVNDILLKVAGRQPLKTPEDLIHAVQDVKDQETLAIQLLRAGKNFFVEVKPEKRKVESTLRADANAFTVTRPVVYPHAFTVTRPVVQTPVVYRVVKPRTMTAPSPIDPSQTAFPFVYPGVDTAFPFVYPGVDGAHLQPFRLPANDGKLDQIDAQLKELTRQIKELKASLEARKETEKTPLPIVPY